MAGTAPKAKDKDGLTRQQRKLVQNHFRGMTYAEAFYGAYPNSKANMMTAVSECRRYLRLPQCQRYLAKLRADAGHRFNVSVERIMDELARVGFSNMIDYTAGDDDGRLRLDLSDLTEDEMAAIASIETEENVIAGEEGEANARVVKTKFKLHDKLSALEKLGRQMGMFKQQHEHDISDPLKELLTKVDGKTRGLPNGN